ncbi:hypothetical protein B0I35DRAFT_484476 [Stachybotrys elegans]|uniref:Rhodopsin domain-containing protein n=1 Tax=Stachybotrys elegans TaxID=80388 RepID=A0A8K0SES6_9HYPO|nr:hypothetical protein B0I35DRAFT_484476 [Stachybotrys elegans]
MDESSFPPYDANAEGLGPFALSFTWILMTIAIGVTVARFVIRFRLSGRWASDDYFMGAALVMQIVYQVFFTLMFRAGAGRTFFNTLPEQRIEINKWTWIAITPGFLNLMLARISIAIMLVCIFGTKAWFKWFAIGLTSLHTVGVWVPSSWFTSRDMYNWTAIALTFISLICDVAYVVLPVKIVWKLNMAMRPGCPLAKITVSLIPLSGNTNLGHPSTRYFAGIINLCSNCEQMLVIILGCLPTLHVVSKMEFRLPNFKSLSSLFQSFLSGSRRQGKSENHSSKWTNITKAVYQAPSITKNDIELRSNGNINDDDDSASTRRALSGPIVGSSEHLALLQELEDEGLDHGDRPGMHVVTLRVQPAKEDQRGESLRPNVH